MRPISMLIVDDEEFARESMRLKIDRSRFDICRLDEAEDAISALDLVKKNQYDIVISDIKMPQMTGLQMIKVLQEEYKKVKIIIVSGYNDFEYAREGLRMGVTDYLLKPVRPDQLNNLIADVCEQIFSDEEELIRKNELENLAQEQQILKISHGINKLLCIEKWECDLEEGIIDNEKTDLKSVFNLTGKPPFVIAVFQLKSHKKTSSEDGLAVYSILEKHLDVCFKGRYLLALNYRNQNEYIVLHNETQSEKSLVNCYSKILLLIGAQMNCDLTIGLSSASFKADELSQIYQQSLVACRNKILSGYNRVICFSNLPVVTATKNCMSESEMLHLDNLIKTQRIKEAKNVISILIKKSITESETYQQLINNILSIYIVLLRSYSVARNSELDRVFLQRLYHLDDSESIERLLFEYMEHLFSQQDLAVMINGEEIVKQSQQYIQQNFSENISLESLSEIYHIHPNYLSRAFKKYTEYNFNEYLTKVRMEKAIFLLRQPSARIQEVSQMLGYTDSKYFSKVFKKHYGITPSQLELIKGVPERMTCDS